MGQSVVSLIQCSYFTDGAVGPEMGSTCPGLQARVGRAGARSEFPDPISGFFPSTPSLDPGGSKEGMGSGGKDRGMDGANGHT